MLEAVELVFFDLDGTLLRNTSASRLIADSLGYGRAFADFEESYRVGRIANADVARVSACHVIGRTVAEMAEILDGGDWIAGIEDVITALHERGIVSVLATVSWDFVAEIVAARYGFAAWCGTPMKRQGEKLTGQLGRPLESHDKAVFVTEVCSQRGVTLERAAAVGDSRSDVPTFRRVGLSIALNADHQARAVASVSCDTNDLRDLLCLLLPQAATPGATSVPRTSIASCVP